MTAFFRFLGRHNRNLENVERRSRLWLYRRRCQGTGPVLHISGLRSVGSEPVNLKEGDRLTFDVDSTREGKTRTADVRRSG